jgi:hypothetical protein
MHWRGIVPTPVIGAVDYIFDFPDIAFASFAVCLPLVTRPGTVTWLVSPPYSNRAPMEHGITVVAIPGRLLDRKRGTLFSTCGSPSVTCPCSITLLVTPVDLDGPFQVRIPWDKASPICNLFLKVAMSRILVLVLVGLLDE